MRTGWWSTLVAFSLAFACHGPDLPTYTGSDGSVNGTWVGTIHEAESGLSSPIVMFLEQVGESVTGVLDYPDVDPEGQLPFAGQEAQCNVADGVFFEGGLTFRFITGEAADVLFSAEYDAARETLFGEWAADTSVESYNGTFEVTRIAWQPMRSSDAGAEYLGCSELPPSECNDSIDNDGDGLLDADDPSCLDNWNTGRTEDFVAICEDGIDNDGDGRVDDDDPECPNGEIGWNPDCADGWDNDGDGLQDLDDPGCLGDPRHYTEVPLQCADGIDNDDDGSIDADDPECEQFSVENIDLPGCSNGHDDDGDGLADLDDPSCQGQANRPFEFSLGTCDDGLDNDGDGLIDEEESHCSIYFLTDEAGLLSYDASESCGNGLDDDGDDLIDLDDPGCTIAFDGWEQDVPEHRQRLEDEARRGQCSDGLDNDGDGRIDTEDLGCSMFLTSAGSLSITSFSSMVGFEDTPPCLDGLDNDHDGLIDRTDPDCVDPFALFEMPECENGIDDDLDGLLDHEDPTCLVGDGDREIRAACNDGQDNDGDGYVDADDPSCLSPQDPIEHAACSDGFDNDGDGYFDLADPECAEDADRESERP